MFKLHKCGKPTYTLPQGEDIGEKAKSSAIFRFNGSDSTTAEPHFRQQTNLWECRRVLRSLVLGDVHWLSSMGNHAALFIIIT